VPEPKSPVVGAAPEGVTDRKAASRAVREMFTSIAPRYDLLNHVLSFNVDRIWWRRTARTFRHILIRPDARILDLCCGTGDMAFALQRQAGTCQPIARPRQSGLKPTPSISRSLIRISTW
jgi:demethylmenaquinone methyltransferase/2-methoxy-6-polyprenyl-1,4-benzoquinol methylase